jgi:hypothetical protein
VVGDKPYALLRSGAETVAQAGRPRKRWNRPTCTGGARGDSPRFKLAREDHLVNDWRILYQAECDHRSQVMV